MENEVIIDYRGPVHYETIGELIHILKEKTGQFGIQTGIYKKILLVMIESLENILKYNEYPDHDNAEDLNIQPTLRVEKQKTVYSVSSSNLLNRTQADRIRTKINFLNNLDEYGLKELYKGIITNGEFSQKGGAGLGLIEMAKVSPHKLDCSFTDYNSNYFRYKIEVKIDG
jgi:hypothetical protein